MPDDRRRPLLFVMTAAQRRGAELECLEVASALRDEGMAVDIAALGPGPAEGALPIEVLGRTQGSWWTWRTWQTWRALRRRSAASPMVVAYGSTTLPACALGLAAGGPPFLYRSIGDPNAWVRGRVHRERTGLMMRRAAGVVCLWEGAAQAMEDLYRVPRERLRIIPTGRSPERFHVPNAEERALARASFGLYEDRLAIAVVGALSEEKQVSLAIRAVAGIDDAVLIVAGDGPQRSELQALADRLMPGRVKFTGVLSDVLPVYHATDVALLASRTEGMPGVIIEAGLCGVASVTTAVGGVGEIIEDGRTGAVVGLAGDEQPVEALRAALERVIADSTVMGAAARERCAERFDSKVVLRGWVEVLTSFGVPPDRPVPQVG